MPATPLSQEIFDTLNLGAAKRVVLHRSGQWNQFLLNNQVAVDYSDKQNLRLGPLERFSS